MALFSAAKSLPLLHAAAFGDIMQTMPLVTKVAAQTRLETFFLYWLQSYRKALNP